MKLLDNIKWEADKVPFSFKYGGIASATLLSKWDYIETQELFEDFAIYRHVYKCPISRLCITAEVKKYKQLPAVEWVLYFHNESDKNTPIIENILPIDISLNATDKNICTVHYVKGSDFTVEDFAPLTSPLSPMAYQENVEIRSSRGRSSDRFLPFFNLQVDSQGLFGALGWTGDWKMSIGRHTDETERHGNVEITGGMKKTRFYLKPNEEIRTPRILLMDWEGELQDSFNKWRKFMLDCYSPKDANNEVIKMPVCHANWGEVACQDQIDKAQEAIDKDLPFDVFWIDAGWYGNAEPQQNSTVFNCKWSEQVGNWWPNKKLYPNGLKPISDLLKKNNKELLLWLEPERVYEGTEIATKHPEWLLGPIGKVSILNLGNSEALQGIIDIVSTQLVDAGATWYRQDFNKCPAKYWNAADDPDRIGITEIKYIQGLYEFLDELKLRIPGLKIDNCASGGRRIDLEMISRSVVLWRTDYPLDINNNDPFGTECHMHGLSFWVPLHQTAFGKILSSKESDLNVFRGAMGPGISVCALEGQPDLDKLIPMLEEYNEIKEYFHCDFYPLLSYSKAMDSWTAWQFHDRDKDAGVAVFIRRPQSGIMTMQANLKRIELEGIYETKLTIGSQLPWVSKITGKELVELEVKLFEKPDSAVLVYKIVMS